MTDAAIAADLRQALNVQCGLATQVAFHGIGLDSVAELLLIGVCQILHADVGVDTRLRQDILGALSADSVDISQSDLDPLILRQVNAGDTCHSLKAPPYLISPVSACAWGSRK